MFGSDFLQHVIVVLTNYSNDEKSEEERQLDPLKKKESLINGLQTYFLQKFEYELSTNQFCFIDNRVPLLKRVSQTEKDVFKNEIDKIKSFTQEQRAPYSSRDVQTVTKENEKLANQLRETELEKLEAINQVEKFKKEQEKMRKECELKEKEFEENFKNQRDEADKQIGRAHV